MNTPLLASLLSDLSDDLHDPNFLWQVGTVLLCFALAWYLSGFLRKSFSGSESSSGMMKIGVESFYRVLFPSLSLICLLIGKGILGRWQHTHLLSLLFPIIGSLALIRFGFYVVRRTFVKEGKIGAFLAIFEKLFAGLVWLGVVLHFTGLSQELFTTLDETVLPIGHNKVSVLSILQALISVAVTLIVALWASAALEARLMLLPTMHTSLKVVLSRLGRAVLILLAILISLTIVGIDLTVLSVFGGALGVGLGFGLQKITSSYVSGFIILLDRSLSIGDMIAVDKFNGRVTQINTRYTVLKGLDGGEAVIPNEMLVSNPVQNFSLSDNSVALGTDITVGYQTDLEALLPILAQTVAEVPRVSKEAPPSAYLMKFGSDGLELRVGFWISDPENGRSNVLSEVNRALWKILQERKIEVPYARRVVTLINAPEKVSEQA
ncbi:mechanosensitive ion channel [Undibacterium sp. Jales W-56]|uniref:mechanosensitive ion channel family protein n=1 Tax=Undibacterium sp. Jales W-56 TaxID=2897325 RepID=UPI0021D1E4DE|nr:mechanosensitive ion channel domain-containing protein [Undibacterium sp. Jales W-56]MCU6435538.1 mechanosensitive ion channel [Undibacterium sp. Jales W-56]